MIKNKRDLGGIRTTEGKTVKHGCLIRSAGLNKAEKKDLKGISLIIDLRTTRETLESVDKIYNVKYLHMPVFDEIKAGISHEREAEHRGFPNMKILYGRMMGDYKEAFSAILKEIMNHDYSTGAVLWHCSVGKDRTGLIAALLLEMLKVDRKIIMEDYLKTNEVMMPEAIESRDQIREIYGDEVAANFFQALIADSDYLEAAWAAMGEDYFSSLGITDEQIEEFRNKVLE